MKTTLILATMLALLSPAAFAKDKKTNLTHHGRIATLHKTVDRKYLPAEEQKKHDADEKRLKDIEKQLADKKDLSPAEHVKLEKDMLEMEQRINARKSGISKIKPIHDKNEADHKRIAKLHKGIPAMHLTPEERAEHEAHAKRIKEIGEKLNQGGLSEKEHGELATELQKMEGAAKVRQLAAERRAVLHKKNMAHYDRIAKLHAKIDVKKLKGPALEKHRLISERLMKHHEALTKGGLTDKEHAEIEKSLLSDEEELKKL